MQRLVSVRTLEVRPLAVGIAFRISLLLPDSAAPNPVRDALEQALSAIDELTPQEKQ